MRWYSIAFSIIFGSPLGLIPQGWISLIIKVVNNVHDSSVLLVPDVWLLFYYFGSSYGTVPFVVL